MNGGSVVSRRFPYLPIHVFVGDQRADFEAILDTGFDGDVIDPDGAFTPMPQAHFNARWILADGFHVETATYNGYAKIGNLGPVQVRISVLGNEPIIGRGIIRRFRLILDHGSTVVLEP